MAASDADDQIAASEPEPAGGIEDEADDVGWESDERSYIFEERLAKAEAIKLRGNKHYVNGEWELAFRRYRRALYHGHIDEMQMFDLMDNHKEQALAIHVPCKLNLVACILKLSQQGQPPQDSEPSPIDGSPRSALDEASELCREVLKIRPNDPKAHFRLGQVLLERGDLRGAEEALGSARKVGDGGGLRETLQRLRELQRQERLREREIFGGSIQSGSLHQQQEAQASVRRRRRDFVLHVLWLLAFPITWLSHRLWQLAGSIEEKLLGGRPGGGTASLVTTAEAGERRERGGKKTQ